MCIGDRFEGQNTRNTRSVQNRSALENRETQMMNQQNIGGLNRSTGGANRTIR